MEIVIPLAIGFGLMAAMTLNARRLASRSPKRPT